MHRIYKLIILAVMSLLILSACGGGNQTTGGTSSGSGATSRNFKFYVITHGQASDPFWSVVKKGVDQAAKDMGGPGDIRGAAHLRYGSDVPSY